ncbi:Endoplasmic reticulum metallopeptidase 1 isoform B [Glycine soja]|nr:Endoplasmic reticulum metallopeptidase 1 isoform B [Glycine soja]
MANSAAQDVFPVIPGDTDYRIFSQDYGDIPGLDIIFLLGGYFYHTSYDTVERLLPGSIQARGENLFSIIKTFTNSANIQNTYKKKSSEVTASTFNDERAVFFDYFSWFMIFYPRWVAKILHSIPVFFFLVMPFTHGRSHSWSAALCDFIKGFMFHAVGIILAVGVPVAFSILRLLFSSQTMNWFAHPYLAFAMFVPCALVGLLIPRIIWRHFPLSQDISIVKTSKEALSDEARFWGAFGFYAVLTLAYLVAGLSGGFVTFFVCASLLPAWISFCLSVKFFGQRSLRSTMFYILPLVPCLAYSVYFGGFLAQFLIERMGMMGSLPLPYGHYVPDVIVAALIGTVTGWCTGPLMPICGHWLARSSILQFLLHLSVFALALSSQFFPYTMSAPKRIVFQHTFHTAGSSQILESTYDFSVTDSNSLLFLFKHSPEVAKELNITSEFSFESASLSKHNDWMAIFPLSFLFSNSLKFPAKKDDILKQYEFFPKLSVQNPSLNSKKGPRRVHLELYLGSLEEVWVAVLNITGPLSSWSFADNLLPGTETYGDGPQSYICRLSGPSDGNWTFWLEANNSEALRVDLAILDQKLVDPIKRLKNLFPDWVDVVAYSSFMSSYIF